MLHVSSSSDYMSVKNLVVAVVAVDFVVEMDWDAGFVGPGCFADSIGLHGLVHDCDRVFHRLFLYSHWDHPDYLENLGNDFDFNVGLVDYFTFE